MQRDQAFDQRFRPGSTKLAGAFLVAVAVGAALFFVVWECFFYSVDMNFKQILAGNDKASSRLPPKELISEQETNLAHYLEMISMKSIFRAVLPDAGFMAASVGSAGEPDLLENIKMIGVLPGEVPQVVLEDLKAQQTAYVSAGQSISGVYVEEVGANSVVLSAGGRRKKLAL